MADKPNIRIEIDPKCKDPEVIIKTDRQSGLVDMIIEAIENCLDETGSQIAVSKGNKVALLNKSEIVRVYTENRKLTVCTQADTYESRLSLTELEEILGEDAFIRISRFEIINLNKVTGFDMTVAGTIKVVFEDGTETWVARRYVKDIREKLKNGFKGVRK